ncbi:MAG: hypothetical protein WCO29_22565 [Nostocales cyanobacterium ELA583]|jgi:hypothetical protein
MNSLPKIIIGLRYPSETHGKTPILWAYNEQTGNYSIENLLHLNYSIPEPSILEFFDRLNTDLSNVQVIASIPFLIKEDSHYYRILASLCFKLTCRFMTSSIEHNGVNYHIGIGYGSKIQNDEPNISDILKELTELNAPRNFQRINHPMLVAVRKTLQLVFGYFFSWKSPSNIMFSDIMYIDPGLSEAYARFLYGNQPNRDYLVQALVKIALNPNLFIYLRSEGVVQSSQDIVEAILCSQKPGGTKNFSVYSATERYGLTILDTTRRDKLDKIPIKYALNVQSCKDLGENNAIKFALLHICKEWKIKLSCFSLRVFDDKGVCEEKTIYDPDEQQSNPHSAGVF